MTHYNERKLIIYEDRSVYVNNENIEFEYNEGPISIDSQKNLKKIESKLEKEQFLIKLISTLEEHPFFPDYSTLRSNQIESLH